MNVPASASQDGSEFQYAYLDIRPEGICSGAFMKPVRGAFGGQNFTSNLRIGWQAEGAIINDSDIGSGVYICPGSTIENKSSTIAGDNNFIEITNSKISGGTRMYGNIIVANSNIDHTDLTNGYSPSFTNPENLSIKISYADITDELNLDFSAPDYIPMMIYGMVNIQGSQDRRVKVQRTRDQESISAAGVESSGTNIYSNTQKLNILNGSQIIDSNILGMAEAMYNDFPLKIDSNSKIDLSVISGQVEILNKAKISSSTIVEGSFTEGAVGKLIVSGANIVSSEVVGTGLIKDENTYLNKATVSGNVNIIIGSSVGDSYVWESNISNSSLSNNSSAFQSTVENNSALGNATLTLVYSSNSNFNNINASSDSSLTIASIINSSLMGPGVLNYDVSNSVCYNVKNDADNLELNCFPRVTPQP